MSKQVPQLVVARESPIDVAFDPFKQVANSLTVPTTYTINPPPSYCYWYWPLKLLGGLTTAMIQEIRLTANTTLIYQISGAALDALNQYAKLPAYGAVATTPTLIIPFKRFGLLSGSQAVDFTAHTFKTGTAKDNALESALNCGSQDANGNSISTLKLEVVLNNTPANGSLGMVASGLGTLPWPGGPGLIPFLETSTFNAAVGKNNLTKNNAFKLGDIMHTLFDGLFMFPEGGGTLDNFQLWYNNTLWMLRSADDMVILQSLAGLRTAQAGMTALDFSADGYGDEDLLIAPTTTDLRMYFTDTAAENITVVQRSLGYLF